MTFGEKIKLIRESKNLSTTKLAKMAGIAQSTLRDIELGNSKATYTSIEKLCSALNMSLVQVLGWNDPSFDEEEFEKQLLNAVRKLSNQQKEALLNFITLL